MAEGFRAVLFDFNGVLMDDEAYHWRAFRDVLGPHGVRLTRARYNERYLVYDDRTALRAMLRDARLDGTLLEPLLVAKRRIFARLTRRLRIERRVASLVRDLARRAPLAVVSGATRGEVVAALRRARLARLFGAIVTTEDVRRPKPSPDGYRLALRRLGLRDGRGCLAFEDSPGGARAARAAGLAVIGVATTFPPAALRRAGATRVVPDLGALAIGDVWPAPRGARLPGRPRKARGVSGLRRRPSRRRSSS